jgi:WD40 repeat protein
VSADGHLAVTGAHDGSVRAWDVTTGKELRRFQGHKDPVFSVAVSAVGRSVLSGGGNTEAQHAGDNVLRLWRLPASVWPKVAPKVSKE